MESALKGNNLLPRSKFFSFRDDPTEKEEKTEKEEMLSLKAYLCTLNLRLYIPHQYHGHQVGIIAVQKLHFFTNLLRSLLLILLK